VASRIVHSADRVCEHIFDLLGSGPVALGPKIDWHTDFKSGYRWDPALPYLDVRFGHLPGVDVKVPWELSRSQHFPLLAQAYWLTGNKRYIEELILQLEHWIENNPVGYGVNWACPMDVAIRAINWLWAVSLAADSTEVTTSFLASLLSSLVAHGRYIRDNLEVRDDGISTNHYLADVLGLLYLGWCLPDSDESLRWRRFAVDSMPREMDAQVWPDGVHYETSLSYHRLVTEMFLSGAALCRHHGQTLPEEFWCRLERMCEFVMAYTKPDGLAPQVGDGDNGRLHCLSHYGGDPRDHRHILGLAGFLFERQDMSARSGPARIEAVWFGDMRPTSAQQKDSPTETSGASGWQAFPHGGFYILHRAHDYVLFNCSPVGTRGLGTHKHNDLLSIELQLGGEDVIVDAGSFLYTSDLDAYNLSRSTSMHSTVMVDGIEQNRLVRDKPFLLHPDAKPRVEESLAAGKAPFLAAQHDGYSRLKDPVVHRRALSFDESSRTLSVEDSFIAPEREAVIHELRWNFIFAPCCTVLPSGDGWTIRTARRCVLLSWPLSDAEKTTKLPVSSELKEVETYPGYGLKQRASALVWKWKGSMPLRAEYSLMAQ
jgi:hypothetical protein